MRKLFLLLFACCFSTFALHAQPVRIGAEAAAPLNFTQELNSGWRVQTSDNPAYAQPGYDDSAWPVVSLTDPAQAKFGWHWYRLRLQLSNRQAPLALMITGGDGTYEVYINGQRIPGPGLRSTLALTHPKQRVISLPAITGTATVALRTFVPPTSMFLANCGALRFELGTAPVIDTANRAAESARINSTLPGVAIHVLEFLSGITVFTLFFFQRERREYFWLGIYLLSMAAGTGIFELAVNSFFPFSLNWFVAAPLVYITAIAQIEFTFSFVGRPVDRGWRIYQGLLITWPALLLLPAWNGLISRGFFNEGEGLLIVPPAFIFSFLLFGWYRRGNREAGWLIFPSLLPLLAIATTDIGVIGSNVGSKRLAAVGSSVAVGPLSFDLFDFADLLFLIAIGIVMFFRFTRVSRAQARAAAELEAARVVQQVLLPEPGVGLAGFTIETQYLPAQEVGGDFYQLVPTTHGGLLVVTGDVSGKGMPAAMLVALLVGAIRTEAAHTTDPAALLTTLNRRVYGRMSSGFATCAALHLSPDGNALLANAANPAPYLNGDEMQLAGTLPLGLVAEGEYENHPLTLRPGDVLTFVSDGVLEATSPTGELFGFDRTAAISTQSALAIAHAAQAFGQEDDITVLTLTLTPVEGVHA